MWPGSSRQVSGDGRVAAVTASKAGAAGAGAQTGRLHGRQRGAPRRGASSAVQELSPADEPVAGGPTPPQTHGPRAAAVRGALAQRRPVGGSGKPGLWAK